MVAVGGPFSFGESGPPVQGPTDEEKRRTDVLLHYDGVSWEMVSLPELPERSSAAQSLFKVWGHKRGRRVRGRRRPPHPSL